jgi:hypothetical protein
MACADTREAVIVKAEITAHTTTVGFCRFILSPVLVERQKRLRSRGRRAAVPWNTVFGFVWIIETVSPSRETKASKVGPLNAIVPVQTGHLRRGQRTSVS